MDWIGALLGALEQGFGLWRTKEGNKYRDEAAALRKEYDNELLKPDEEQSDLTLVRVKRRLRILYRTFVEFKPSDK